MEGITNFQNRQEVLDLISTKMDNSPKWVFISTEVVDDKEIPFLMSPDRNHALDCIMHVLKQEPEWWNILKNTIDKSENK